MNPYYTNFNSRYSIYNTVEKCNECDDSTIEELCDKCGNGVCNNESCSWLFPSYNKTNCILCISCFNTIDKKLTVLIDDNKLQLLKKKIHKKLEKKLQTAKSIGGT